MITGPFPSLDSAPPVSRVDLRQCEKPRMGKLCRKILAERFYILQNGNVPQTLADGLFRLKMDALQKRNDAQIASGGIFQRLFDPKALFERLYGRNPFDELHNAILVLCRSDRDLLFARKSRRGGVFGS